MIHRPSPLMKPCEITDALKDLVQEGNCCHLYQIFSAHSMNY
nr:hypothetical protein [Staphylococcus pseudintermedius]